MDTLLREELLPMRLEIVAVETEALYIDAFIDMKYVLLMFDTDALVHDKLRTETFVAY